jgi:hypothetical protein
MKLVGELRIGERLPHRLAKNLDALLRCFRGRKTLWPESLKKRTFRVAFFSRRSGEASKLRYLRKARMSLSDGNFDAGLNIRESFFKPLAIGE